MIVALYGIYGTYNFGCEAIVRGACKFLTDIFREVHIRYYSYSYEYDKKMLFDLDVEVVPVIENKSVSRRSINKGLRMLGVNHQLFYFNQKKMLSDVDMILSIGGDIYTIPSVLREQNEYPYYNSLVDFCEKSGKPIVVYGASVGPFGDYYKAVEYYSYYMKKYKAILCREASSVSYLRGLGFNNVTFFPDPAFQIGEGKNNNGKYIGINLSPLSLDEVYGNHDEHRLKQLASLIDRIFERFNRNIMFLPHVLSKDEADNDLWFMKKIKDVMKYKDQVTIANSAGGFLGIKESIRNCHIVISARMHCAINAMEENVPTILLSYSQKSIGMCEYVYGDNYWCVDLKKLEEELLSRITEMLEKHDMISETLTKRNIEIKDEYKSNIKKVKKRIC